MPYQSQPDLLVLLGLRLRSFAPVEAVALSAGLPVDEVAALLDTMAASGFAAYRDGRVAGWLATPAGRTEGERRLAAELDHSGCRDAVAGSYARFLTVNQRLLDACTTWQLREVDGRQVINDHADEAHDAEARATLVAIDQIIQPVCAELAECLARFGGYGPRLAASLAKVQGGDADWFTKPTIDSYHSVWFEMHENLLATLGLDRATEVAP